jgi:hypothetical protein
VSTTDNPRWRLEDIDGKYTLDFDSMTFTVRSESFTSTAVGAGHDSDLTALEEWFADAHTLEQAGWTQAEYVQRGMAAFDLRRSGDGYWEARPKERYWRRSIDRLKRALEGAFARDSDKDDFRKLMGEDFDTARARGIGLLQRLPPAPWEGMGNVGARVEEEYQRYLRKKVGSDGA